MIRDERPEDEPGLRLVLEAAFPEAVEADLVDRLRQTCPERVSLVAFADDRVVGQSGSPGTLESLEALTDA